MTSESTTKSTEQILVEMLTENTGSHFLDSGSAYGRNWERNRGATVEDFDKTPDAWFDKHGGIRASLYHFLKDRLEYDPEMDRQFHEFAERPENKEEGWSVLEEAFIVDVRKISKEAEFNHGTVNTYNGEDLLDQVIQYDYWEDEEREETFVLLQIHGGCDVRGGYTSPKAFRVPGDGITTLFDNAHCSVWCPEKGCPFIADSDDAGYNFYTAYERELPLLKKKESVDRTIKDDDWEKDEEGTSLCPECKHGLEVGMWPAS